MPTQLCHGSPEVLLNLQGPMEPVYTPLHQYKQDSNPPLLTCWRREKCEILLSINHQYLYTYAFIYVLQVVHNLLKELLSNVLSQLYNYEYHIFSVFSKLFFIKSIAFITTIKSIKKFNNGSFNS